jgi:hypothetical protein
MSDAGPTLQFRGAGQLRALGRVKVTASVQALGFVNISRAEGYVNISASNGGITLHLIGPLQHGLSEPPESFQYVIQGGTGAYEGATGKGRVDLLMPSKPFVATSQGMLKQGPFSLVIHPLGA